MSDVTKKFFTIFVMLLLFSANAGADTGTGAGTGTNNSVKDDTTAQVICKIVNYIWTIGGPLMTVVIIGASLLAIFGRMPWPALFALGAFTAVFFGAPKVVSAITGSISGITIARCGANGTVESNNKGS